MRPNQGNAPSAWERDRRCPLRYAGHPGTRVFPPPALHAHAPEKHGNFSLRRFPHDLMIGMLREAPMDEFTSQEV